MKIPGDSIPLGLVRFLKKTQRVFLRMKLKKVDLGAHWSTCIQLITYLEERGWYRAS